MSKNLRKLTATVLALILCLSCTIVASAEADVQEDERISNIKEAPVGEFDYKVLQNEEGFSFDKFEKYWSYYAAYDEAYSDADVIIAIKLFGEDGGNNLEEADLYTRVVDKKGNKIDTVSSMDFLIDDVLYSYNSMPTEEGTMAGSVFLYDTGYELVKAFADAKEVSVKLSFYDNSTITIDLDMVQFSTTLQRLCKNIVKYNIWDYYISNSMMGAMESVWDLTITY